MIPKQLPRFDAAIQSFREFIAGQNQCSDIRWIFREDIVELRRQVFIRLPLANAEKLVEERYVE